MYGIEHTGILPNQQQNPLDTWRDLQRQQMEQQRYQQQMQMQQEHYNNGLLSDLANRLDFKDFATGTVFDPVFQHNLDAGLQGIAETLKKGGSYTDALMQAMRTAGEVGNYSNLIKKKRAEIDAAAKLYDKDLSIDGEALRKHALTRYLFNPDHTMKDTSQLADDNDYVSSLIENNPELVTKGLGSLYDQVEKGKYVPYKGEITRDEGGIKRLQAYEGKYDPLYNELVNAKGMPVTDNTATGVRVKSAPITIGGQKIEGVDDDVLNHFYQNPGTRAAIRAEARSMKAKGVLPPDANLADVEKVILHRELKNSANSFINKTKDDYDASQLVGMENARALKYLGASLRESKKETQPDEVTINDVFSTIKSSVDNKDPQYKGVALTTIPNDAQKAILEEARKVTGINGIGNKHIYLAKDKNGDYGIYFNDDQKDNSGNELWKRNQLITTVTQKGINLKAQPSVKEKRAVLSGNTSAKPAPQHSDEADPLGLGIIKKKK